MYIKRIKLVNYIGIYSGTGRTEIEIKFPNPEKLKSNIFMFMGENGSGKSTLLSALHPFAGIYDSRDDQFIRKGYDGRKEIDIDCDGEIYKITHIYKNSAKKFKTHCYIVKGSEELNPNGGVNSFKDIIKQLWGLEEDFFKIGRLASKTSNFIEMPIAARKDMIVNYLPSVEPYLMAFKEASKNCTEAEKELNYLARELKSIGEIDEYMNRADSLQNLIQTKKDLLAQQNVVLGQILAQKEVLEKDNNIKDAQPIIERKKILEADLELMIQEGKIFLGKNSYLIEYAKNINSLNDFITNCQNKSIELEKELSIRDFEIKRIRQDKENGEKRLEDLDKKLRSFKTFNKSSEDLEKEVSFIQNKINKLKEETKEEREAFSHLNLDLYTTKLRSSYKIFLSELIGKIDEVITFLSPYSEKDLKVFCTKTKREAIIEKEKLEKKLIHIQEDAEKLADLFSKTQAQTKFAEILQQRPKECKIDSCEFLKQGWVGLKAQKEIPDIEQKIIKNKEAQNAISADMEFCNSIIIFNDFISSILNNRMKFDKTVCELFIILCNIYIDFDIKWDENFFISFMSSKNNQKILIDNLNDMKESEGFFDYLEKETELKQTSQALENSKEMLSYVMNNSEQLALTKKEMEEIKVSIKSIKENLDKAEEELIHMRSQNEELKEHISSAQKFKIMKENFHDMQKDIDDLGSQIASLGESIEKYNDLSNQEIAQKEKISDSEASIQNEEKELSNVNLKISKYYDYKKRYDAHVISAQKKKLIKESCDPKKGIPLQFMQNFLDTTETFCNELLDIAYHGAFQIKFEVDEKNFSIPVFKEDGESRPDVKYLSDGETSLVKTIISLSLLSKYTGFFPIFCLDEVDAVLDKKFRHSFVNILLGQIKRLNISQVFLISHNEEFMDDSINLILFPHHDYDRGMGKIIAEF